VPNYYAINLPTLYYWSRWAHRVLRDTDHTDSSSDDVVKKSVEYRRSGPRHDFASSVKVVDPRSGKQIVSITSNLSRSGCHVRTSTPFEPGTKIEITIRHRGVTFRCDAEVVYAIPGVGMGIRFENDTAVEESLDGWLVQISDQVREHRPKGTDLAASAKQNIILIICIVTLAAAMASALWLGVLR
jgi:hypothetical protein